MRTVAKWAPKDSRAIIAHAPFVDAVTTMLDESIPPHDERVRRVGLIRRRSRTTTTSSNTRRTITSPRVHRYHDTAREYALILDQLGRAQ
jgi:protease II